MREDTSDSEGSEDDNFVSIQTAAPREVSKPPVPAPRRTKQAGHIGSPTTTPELVRASPSGLNHDAKEFIPVSEQQTEGIAAAAPRPTLTEPMGTEPVEIPSEAPQQATAPEQATAAEPHTIPESVTVQEPGAHDQCPVAAEPARQDIREEADRPATDATGDEPHPDRAERRYPARQRQPPQRLAFQQLGEPSQDQGAVNAVQTNSLPMYGLYDTTLQRPPATWWPHTPGHWNTTAMQPRPKMQVLPWQQWYSAPPYLVPPYPASPYPVSPYPVSPYLTPPYPA